MPNHLHLQFESSQAYRSAFYLSNYVWQVINNWDQFNKMTLGQQFIRAVDSISANIAEGYGRYHKKDKIKFYYYAKGSATESRDHYLKAINRGLLTEQQTKIIKTYLEKLPREINGLISYTNNKLTI